MSNTTPVFTINQNVTDPTDTVTTIDTSGAWPGNGKKAFSLDPTGANQNVTTGVSADGAKLTLNQDGSISYDPSTSSTLSSLPSGQSATDTFAYTVVVGAKSIETVNVSVAVSYTGTDHAYSPTLQNTSGNTVGGRPGMEIDASNSGVLEFGVSNIGTHPITSATLDTREIGFLWPPGGSTTFDVNIYAFNGTGDIAADLAQVGTLVGTGQMSRAGDLFDANLNPSALNQVLSQGSDLAFKLVAGTTNGSAGALDTGVTGVQGYDGFHLNLTA